MFLVFFEFYMASRRPQRYLETFLEPVASFSQSMSPYRATPTPFTPKIMTFPPPNHLRQPTNFVGRPELLWVDLPIYSPSNFGDPSRLVRNALVCRHFHHEKYTNSGESSYAIFCRQTYKNNKFQGGPFLDFQYFSEEYIFRKHTSGFVEPTHDF